MSKQKHETLPQLVMCNDCNSSKHFYLQPEADVSYNNENALDAWICAICHGRNCKPADERFKSFTMRELEVS